MQRETYRQGHSNRRGAQRREGFKAGMEERAQGDGKNQPKGPFHCLYTHTRGGGAALDKRAHHDHDVGGFATLASRCLRPRVEKLPILQMVPILVKMSRERVTWRTRLLQAKHYMPHQATHTHFAKQGIAYPISRPCQVVS